MLFSYPRGRRRHLLVVLSLAGIMPLAACVTLLGDYSQGGSTDGGGDAPESDATGPDTGDAMSGDAPLRGTPEAGLETSVVSDAGLSIQPATVAFNHEPYEQTSAAMEVTLTNGGSATTGALQATLTGANAGDFALDAGGCATLAPSATCHMSVSFTPTTTGARAATLQVTASPGGTVAAGLTGAGDAVYSALSDVSKWSVFDMTTVNTNADGLEASAFDGRYLYFAGETSVVMRFDTQAPTLGTATAWTAFDLSTVNSMAYGFEGAVFDGRFVYLVPALGNAGDLMVRYDTQGAFTGASAWSTYDVGTLTPSANGFAGAAFDGRFIYLVPNANNSGASSETARYDTQGTFTNQSSWVTFDLSTVNAAASGYSGAAFDGRYVYYAPGTGLVARYDTTAAFATGASWTFFDVSTVNPDAKGFSGAAFDGRYVYLVPAASTVGTVARYDTQASFATAGSWSTFASGSVGDAGASGYVGSAFDGRYVYFVPSFNTPMGEFDAIVSRYDTTTAAFTTASSWSTYDIAIVNPQATGFRTAAFDGRYVYFVPNDDGSQDGIIARFDSKEPPSMPASYKGSFY